MTIWVHVRNWVLPFRMTGLYCTQQSVSLKKTYRFDVIVEGSHEVSSGDLQLLCPLHVHFHCRCSLEKNRPDNYIKPVSGLRGTTSVYMHFLSFLWEVGTKEAGGFNKRNYQVAWEIKKPMLFVFPFIWLSVCVIANLTQLNTAMNILYKLDFWRALDVSLSHHLPVHLSCCVPEAFNHIL